MAARIVKVEPFDLVVFGGTGRSRLSQIVPRAVSPRNERSVQRTDAHHRRVAAPARSRGVSRLGQGRAGQVRPRGPRRRTSSSIASSQRLDYVAVDAVGEAGWEQLKTLLGADERMRAYYLATGPDLFGPIAKRLGETGLATPRSRIIVEKPIGNDGASADAINDAIGVGLPREEHLSHRPLPRQGVGAESDGAALRQRAARAAVEQRARRSRADHGRRDARRRRARRLLRRIRRDPRHGAEPHAAAPLPRRDGAAVLAAGRRAARRETEGAEIAGDDRRLQRVRGDRARAISRRIRRGRARRRPISRTSARRRARPKPSSR